ncbi:ABC transporter permease [Spirilliplanes yamanashiensis]|uniref:ABC transporter permease n=2 Tax=Spirilliplanes yamanashiensis TaxID=42233 RepID=A0A8J4DMB8_9ACTN|nr:ECF transporter S component [Spirilliplanes yamanashiensis]MDP9816532.1 energy-coupling factor transport system substrate-specific component [Spirilliplanes yamanashiensis]GIJ06059.1 ABC transporter permease [Spirilliplanes yamanashiensis]
MNNRWRTIDIVVASVIAVAFGVIFWAWGLLWNGPADAIPLPFRAVLYGVWLVPAVLGGLVVRKPGAAFYTLTLAALVSVALGTSWGWTLVLQGPIEALAAELAFAAFAYRAWNLPVALLAGALAGVAAAVYDAFVWYGGTSWATMRLPYIAITALSALVVAGLGSVYLTRALAQTGVLDRFPSGRERAAV